MRRTVSVARKSTVVDSPDFLQRCLNKPEGLVFSYAFSMVQQELVVVADAIRCRDRNDTPDDEKNDG